MERLSLQKCQEHSGQKEDVIILGKYNITIRPISPAQLDYLAPFLKRLFTSLKNIDKEKEIFKAILEVAFTKDTINDTKEIIYSVLNRPDAIVTDSEKKEYKLFTYVDFNNYFEIQDLVKIARVIWEQNTKNIIPLFQDSKQLKKEKIDKGKDEKKQIAISQ